MKNKMIHKAVRKVCSEEEIRDGRCKCKTEVKIGQNNLVPHETTDLVCHKEIKMN